MVGLKIVRDLREKGRGIVFLADSEGDTCIEIINTPDGDDAGKYQSMILEFLCIQPVAGDGLLIINV